MPMSKPCYLYQCPCPHSELLLAPVSLGDPPRPVDRSDWGSCKITAFSLGPGTNESLRVCALQEWSFCFSQPCGVPVIKPHWLSKPSALGAPLPSARTTERGALHGALNPPPLGEPLWYNYFPVWVVHLLSMRFDCIVNAPLLPSCCGFFFVFGCRASLLGGLSLFGRRLFSS